jgi:hypothetical protein
MRLRDWQGRLARLFAERREASFEWGTHDCAMFAADAVLAVTGEDPAAEFRGKYKSESGAAKILKTANLEALADARFARTERPIVGDIGLVTLPHSGQGALAVYGGQFWHVPGDRGLAQFRHAIVSWKVR